MALAGFVPEMSGDVDLAHPLLAYVHGGLMMSWLALLIAQTGFIAFDHVHWHRVTGMAALGIAGAMWVSMGVVSFAQLAKFASYDVLLVQLMGMALFALFFVGGMLRRRKAADHKRLMTLATVVLLQPALDRMTWLPGFALPEYWPQAIWLYVMVMPLVAFDTLSIGRLHPVTRFGIIAIAAAHMGISLFWTSPGWLDMARAATSAISSMR